MNNPIRISDQLESDGDASQVENNFMRSAIEIPPAIIAFSLMTFGKSAYADSSPKDAFSYA
ncbi:hypothetical protein [Paraburkholderia sp. GAS348]|uniref:hypothetical protein n=1 Tax=Paraburkholderia sp. GAS348 TaxID=3035132 RepID=UPI003D1C75FF